MSDVEVGKNGFFIYFYLQIHCMYIHVFVNWLVIKYCMVKKAKKARMYVEYLHLIVILGIEK